MAHEQTGGPQNDSELLPRTNFLGYALMVNSLTILEHQARSGRSRDLLAA